MGLLVKRRGVMWRAANVVYQVSGKLTLMRIKLGIEQNPEHNHRTYSLVGSRTCTYLRSVKL